MKENTVKCPGCGKKEAVPAGRARPGSWIEVINPLFGEPWTSGPVCSHRCAFKVRLKAIWNRNPAPSHQG